MPNLQYSNTEKDKPLLKKESGIRKLPEEAPLGLFQTNPIA